MIVVDTSALMAILLDEPEADACGEAMATAETLAISAGTVAEALVVSDRRGCGTEMRRLIDGLGFDVAAVTAATAESVADAYARWGKGVHPAGLNFGDCFAYALARGKGAPLLYVGTDFTCTDLASVLPPDGGRPAR